MSEVCVTSDRFWREFKSDVAGTLSSEQRGEIERVLKLPSASGDIGDMRLSFKWFFVRLAWGPEKRSPDRVKHEQEAHPVMTRRNIPVLATLFAGYSALAYVIAAFAAIAAVYFLR